MAEPNEDSEDESEVEPEIKLVDSEKAACELEQLDVSVTVLSNPVTLNCSVLMHYNACYLGFGLSCFVRGQNRPSDDSVMLGC